MALILRRFETESATIRCVSCTLRRTVLKQKSSRTLGSGDSVAEKFGSQTDAAISRRKSLVAVSLARPHTTKHHADKPSNPFASQNLQIAARIVRFPKNIFVWETE